MQEVKYLTKEQESEAKHFKDPATNLDLDVTDKVRAALCRACVRCAVADGATNRTWT